MAALTDQGHRREQVKVANKAAAVVTELARQLRRGQLSVDQFVAAVVATQSVSHKVAVELAFEYVNGLRSTEAPDKVGVTDSDPFDPMEVAARSREVAQLIGNSTTDAAFSKVLNALVGDSRHWSLSAGRSAVIKSARAAKSRWRRVSDGNPCAFCAMLVAAGPVYGSKESAGGRFHKHCGCGIAEVHGTWTPTDSEQRYIDDYRRAADRLRARGESIGTANVTREMRAQATS